MNYFTDSVYEKMMVQKPRYGQKKTSPAPNKKRDGAINQKKSAPTNKERKAK